MNALSTYLITYLLTSKQRCAAITIVVPIPSRSRGSIPILIPFTFQSDSSFPFPLPVTTIFRTLESRERCIQCHAYETEYYQVGKLHRKHYRSSFLIIVICHYLSLVSQLSLIMFDVFLSPHVGLFYICVIPIPMMLFPFNGNPIPTGIPIPMRTFTSKKPRPISATVHNHHIVPQWHYMTRPDRPASERWTADCRCALPRPWLF